MTKKSELLADMRRLAGLKPMTLAEKEIIDAKEEELNENAANFGDKMAAPFKKKGDKEEEEEHDSKKKGDGEEEEFDPAVFKKGKDKKDDKADDKKKGDDEEEEFDPAVFKKGKDKKDDKDKDEEEEDSKYQAFFKKMLDAHGGSIKDMSDEEKKKFFASVESAWNSKDEKGKDGEVKESENPDKDKAGASVGADMTMVMGDKEVVPSKLMVDMMESLVSVTEGNTEEMAMVINEMIFEACSSIEAKYTKLRDMINRGEVSKSMMVHEGKDGPVFGEKMDEAKMNEMYLGSSEDSMAAAGQAILNFYAIAEGKDEDADTDVGVDKKVRDADKKVSDLKDIKKDDELTKDKKKMTDKVTEGRSMQDRVDDLRVFKAALK